MAGRRLALIVATDTYDDPGLRQLRAPAKDAEALAGVLGDPELGEFEVDIVRNQTSSAIGERVETLLGGAKLDDLIVMHFSCHGLKDDSGELFLAATNTRPNLLASTSVDAALVNRLIARSRAQRVVLFLDCCYGGAFERGVVHRAGGVVDVSDQFRQQDHELGGGRGRVVITASNAMEFAFEGTDLADTIEQQPSIFTGALVEGLATGAADRDQDGMVSLGELYEYVFDRVRRESPNQTPGKWEFGVQGELFLARNPQRVIVPAPLPAELLGLVDHPFPATRLGSVEALARLAQGTNLPVAAGAWAVLERMTGDDSRSVAAAATEVVERTKLSLTADAIDLGTVARGEPAVAEVLIEGAPLAASSRVESSTPQVRVRRTDRTIRIEADTSVEGSIDGIVTVRGPAGTGEIRVVGSVGPVAVAAPAAPEAAAPPAEAPALGEADTEALAVAPAEAPAPTPTEAEAPVQGEAAVEAEVTAPAEAEAPGQHEAVVTAELARPFAPAVTAAPATNVAPPPANTGMAAADVRTPTVNPVLLLAWQRGYVQTLIGAVIGLWLALASSGTFETDLEFFGRAGISWLVGAGVAGVALRVTGCSAAGATVGALALLTPFALVGMKEGWVLWASALLLPFPARAGALWLTDRTSTRDGQSVAMRAGARAFIGALIGDVIASVWYYNSSWDWKFDEWDLTFSVVLILFDVVMYTVIVASVEVLAPPIRVPDGWAYGPLRRHRLTTSAVQGAAAGLIIGTVSGVLLFEIWFPGYDPNLTPYNQLLVTPVSLAIGFVVAEAILSRTRIGTES